jgi:hypothetical protein
MRKIAVMLPIGYRGGSLRAAKNIAKGLAYQAEKHNDEVQIVFSYSKNGNYNLYTDFDDLTRAGIALRETIWKIYPREALQTAVTLIDMDRKPFEHNEYCLPTDGANDFYDCDLWIIISDRLPAPLFPLKKYACVVYDYIQRYVPEIFGNGNDVWDAQALNLFTLVRNAEKVFVTTPSTRADIISYVGVQPGRISLLELSFEPIDPNVIDTPNLYVPEDYFIWTTNGSFHKNIVNALNALEYYIQELGGALNIVVTGYSSEYFDIENKFETNDPMLVFPQIAYVRNKISKNSNLREKIRVLGNISDEMYAYVLERAKFLWHPALYDNGTFSVIEAAFLKTPSLSARYPAMEYINSKFNLNLLWFNPHNSREMAKTLSEMEKIYHSIELPGRDVLLQSSWQSNSLLLYKAIKELL